MANNIVTTGGGSEAWYDASTGGYVLNETTIANGEVFTALAAQHPELAAIVKWTSGNQRPSRQGGIFERDRYVTPTNLFQQFDVARHAAEYDDVVSGILETLESLAFSRVDFETEDEDEEDVWNQIAAEVDLDGRLREIWRELNIASQVYVATYWGTKDFKVRGKSDKGVTRKKTFANLKVPLAITLLDPKKVVPVGNFLFNQEKLVYIADQAEREAFDAVLAGATEGDAIVRQMVLGHYDPTPMERRWVQDMGADVEPVHMYLLNPQNVFRHTLTRPQFTHLASVRLSSVFELLDMKTQLREMDRAHLVGGTNFIVLVKKGTDQLPANPREIQSLGAQVRMQARVPVIVGDHRLSVEIITPAQDHVLNPAKYDVIDTRIGTRLLQMFINNAGSGGMRGQDPANLARVVAAGMESRRHMIRRSVEKWIIKPTLDANEQFKNMPKLAFHPRRISLDFDTGLSAYLLDLRDRHEISRDTLLSEFDYSQDDEANKLEREKAQYDDIFKTQVPFSTPVADPNQQPGIQPPGGGQPPGGAQDPRSAGRNRGGNRTTGGTKSGGRAPGNSGQGKSKEQQR